jgi:anti-sigma-K factor RskA
MINNLPQPAPGKQYQLWALIDGQPHDLGVCDFEIKKRLLVQMKGVHNAQAFAITLEPTGGSPGPTLEAMYAHGEL